MAEDKLPCWRPVSMVATNSDNVMSRLPAISFRPFQNASSRLTLVLCPAMTMERFMTGDFIASLPFRSGAGRERGGPSHRPPHRSHGRTWSDRGEGGLQPRRVARACARTLYARCEA